MTTSRWSSRVCGDPTSSPRSSRRTAASLATATGLAVLLAAAPAGAANNPGTGDPGFFTFRPSSAIGGTQINVASGNALVRTRDLASSTANYNVVVDRAYNSLAPDTFSILSPRWAFDVGPTNGLTVESNQDVTVSGPSGYKIRFARQSDGSYTPPAGFDGSLTKTSSGWTLTRTSQNDQFGYDNNGKLTWTKDAAARDFTVQGTSAAGRDVLSSYGTSSGRRVNLSYTGDSLVREMDDPSSGHQYYRYTNGRLTQYESPSGAITTYRYDGNGRLDKITEPGGTTVELTTTAGGRVSSITTTLPGGSPQTTSFVYTRRPYKTDVTGPDSVRRTYAYDDDWRVTRQYNPDVKPTVTATGELRDLADGYVGPNRAYPLSVAADEPDGAGLRRLSIERTSGTEIAGVDVPCTTTPFDLVCPNSHTATVDSSFAAVPEGRQTIRAAAVDDEGNRGISDSWDVLVDRSGPDAPTGHRLEYFDPHDPVPTATIGWNADNDPDLPDGSPGSGVSHTDVRFRVGGSAFSPWTPADEDSLDVTDVRAGDVVDVETRSVDEVWNVSAVSAASITVTTQLEDPAITDMAAEAYVDEYGGTMDAARAWMDVQTRASSVSNGDLGSEVSDAAPGRYGGIWYDNSTKKVAVGLVAGGSNTPAQQVLSSRGLANDAVIRTVDYTQSQLENAQPPLEDELDDLIEDHLVAISRSTSANAIEIEVGTAATASQRARIVTAANNAPVRVNRVDAGSPTIEDEASGCKWPNCDPPLRGGVKIESTSEKCTAGFLARSNTDSKLYMMTAGHCEDDSDTRLWFIYGKAKNEQTLGFTYRFVNDKRGDAGLIEVTPSLVADARPWIFLTKQTISGSVRSTRNPHYRVSGSSPNREGQYVCFNGATSGGRCGKVVALNKTFNGDKVVKNLAQMNVCSAKGDSGAPMVRGGRAFGTLVGSRKRAITGRCIGTFYTGARVAEGLLNVTISK